MSTRAWKLENMRETADPKCWNCSWWQGSEAEFGGTFGTCGRHEVKTLDLAVCSAWRPQSKKDPDIIEPGDDAA